MSHPHTAHIEEKKKRSSTCVQWVVLPVEPAGWSCWQHGHRSCAFGSQTCWKFSLPSPLLLPVSKKTRVGDSLAHLWTLLRLGFNGHLYFDYLFYYPAFYHFIVTNIVYHFVKIVQLIHIFLFFRDTWTPFTRLFLLSTHHFAHGTICNYVCMN